MAQHKVVITGVDTASLPVMSSNETIQKIQAYQKGDLQAREQVILGNLKLVLSIVNKFAKRTDNLDDLFQIGVVGLMKAIENFSLEHEVKFSTYAVPMILGEIKRYLRDNSFLRISRQVKDRAYHALKAKEEWIASYQREPTYEELATAIGATYYEIVECFDAIASVVSLSDPLFNDFEDSMELIDVLPSDANCVERMLNSLSLQEGMKSLNEMEKTIIQKRYFEGETQLEIANEFAISQAQVSRLEKSALKTLKNYF